MPRVDTAVWSRQVFPFPTDDPPESGEHVRFTQLDLDKAAAEAAENTILQIESKLFEVLTHPHSPAPRRGALVTSP